MRILNNRLVEPHDDRAVTAFNGKIILLCSKCNNAHVYQDERVATCKTCGAKRASLSGFILHLENPVQPKYKENLFLLRLLGRIFD